MEVTEEENDVRIKKEKIFSTVKRLAIFQIWLGLSILFLCIGMSASMDDVYWLNYNRVDFTVSFFIIFTGCIGVASGIYQRSAILNGTFMTFNFICIILSLGAVVKSGLNLSKATKNWTFPISNGMIFYLILFAVMIFECIYSVVMVIYCLNSANGCNKIVKPRGYKAALNILANISNSDPTYPMFVTQRGQMMVLPTPSSQITVLTRQRNYLTPYAPPPAYRSPSQPRMLPSDCHSTRRISPPPYNGGDENWTWM